jgi:pimeloyl-ACP methyl ester carboxylesterase
MRALTTPDRPADPPVRTASLPTGPFTYTLEGEGAALVLLHGLPGSVRDYRWLAPALEGARVIRLDQPGFGGTPTTTAPDPSLEGRARFVRDALALLGVERFVVLGHSMGGPLAMAVAASAHEHVRGLALLASVGLRPHRLLRRLGRSPDLPRLLDVPVLGALLLRGPVRRGFAKAGFPASTPEPAIRQSIRVVSRLSFPEVQAAVARVRAPSFVAWAEDDPLVEGAIGLELGTALPPGPRLTFERGGHNVQKTQALELGAALSAWIGSLEQGALAKT